MLVCLKAHSGWAPVCGGQRDPFSAAHPESVSLASVKPSRQPQSCCRLNRPSQAQHEWHFEIHGPKLIREPQHRSCFELCHHQWGQYLPDTEQLKHEKMIVINDVPFAGMDFCSPADGTFTTILSMLAGGWTLQTLETLIQPFINFVVAFLNAWLTARDRKDSLRLPRLSMTCSNTWWHSWYQTWRHPSPWTAQGLQNRCPSTGFCECCKCVAWVCGWCHFCWCQPQKSSYHHFRWDMSSATVLHELEVEETSSSVKFGNSRVLIR